MGKIKDLTNMTFGRLTAQAAVGSTKQGATLWCCRCSCGNETVVRGYSLMQGNTKSCGCLPLEGTRTTHGLAQTPIYRVWSSMRHRCQQPSNRSWANYGGRGIKVCERWQKFENWLVDMGPRPEGAMIERRDNNGDYEPGNCYWATRTEQNKNRRNTRLITANGETLHLAEWARRLGVSHITVLARIEAGWDEARAVTQPLGGKRS